MYALHIVFLLGLGMMVCTVQHTLGAQPRNVSEYSIIITKQINQTEIVSKTAFHHQTRN